MTVRSGQPKSSNLRVMRPAGLAVLAFVSACGGAEKQTAKEPTEKTMDTDAPALAPEEEKLGETRDVQFSTEDGIVIQGTFHPSPTRRNSTEKPDGVVLLIHQRGSTRQEWAAFSPLIVEHRSVLSIDMRGHGESLYRADGSAIDQENFSDEDWKNVVLDVRAAVSYLRDLQPPPSSITLVGSSIGSSAALLYASEDPEVSAVALLSPGLGYRGLKTSAAARKLGGRPTLIVATTGDRASAKAARSLARRIKGSTLRIFKGSGHGVTMTGPIVPEVLSFLGGLP